MFFFLILQCTHASSVGKYFTQRVPFTLTRSEPTPASRISSSAHTASDSTPFSQSYCVTLIRLTCQCQGHPIRRRPIMLYRQGHLGSTTVHNLSSLSLRYKVQHPANQKSPSRNWTRLFLLLLEQCQPIISKKSQLRRNLTSHWITRMSSGSSATNVECSSSLGNVSTFISTLNTHRSTRTRAPIVKRYSLPRALDFVTSVGCMPRPSRNFPAIIARSSVLFIMS